MSDDEELKALRSILDSIAAAVGMTIEANGGWDPRPGSRAAREIAEQGPYIARSKTPVLDAHSIALARLSSATEHFSALARLIEEPAFAYAPASLARTALENSARAWWAFDPALDVKMRIARGRTDMIVNLNEVARVFGSIERLVNDAERASFEEARDKAASRLSAIAEDSMAIGLNVLRSKKGALMGVEEMPVGPTAVIVAQLGDMGRVAYHDLSAVAHGTLTGVMSRLDQVARSTTMEGVALAAPSVKMPALRNAIAIALLSYRGATDRRMELYGWDMALWNKWKRESAMVLAPLLRDEGVQSVQGADAALA
jgi:hypothetical protein